MQFSETFEKKLWETSIFRRVADCQKVSKISLHYNKIPNSLRQVLCPAKKVLQKQSAKIDLKVPGKSCDEIDDDVMKFIL